MQYCKDKGIHVTGYSCLGSTDSPLYKDETLLGIAKPKVTPPGRNSIVVSWLVHARSPVSLTLPLLPPWPTILRTRRCPAGMRTRR